MIQIKNKVIISDPCYSRRSKFMTEQDNMLEGDYNYYVEELTDENRIKSIEIVHSKYKRPKKWKYKNNLVGVDSGQAGIFCDSIYPEGDTGEVDTDSFYGKCCDLTMQNYEEEPEDLEELIDVHLYDLTLDSEENFQDGIETKYILLPINKDGVVNETSFTPLLNAGGKIIISNDKLRQNMDYVTDFFVVDYNTMFGLRLLIFQK